MVSLLQFILFKDLHITAVAGSSPTVSNNTVAIIGLKLLLYRSNKIGCDTGMACCQRSIPNQITYRLI